MFVTGCNSHTWFLENIEHEAWVKREFRLTRSTDLKRVRNSGKSYAHPLVVLVVSPSAAGRLKVAVTGGRSVGGAVQRNRAKRLLRESVRALLPAIRPDRELVLIARKPVLEATFKQVQAAVSQLLHRAGLLLSE